MPAGPFMGAGLGQMMSGMTQGMAQGQLTRMLLDRKDRQDALREQQIKMQNDTHRQASVKGFIEGAANFYKVTGDPNATLKFWNENAGQFGLGKLDSIQPTRNPDEIQLTYVEDSGQKIPMVFNKTLGTIAPVTMAGTGQAYTPNPSMKQQAEEMEGATRLDMMSGAEIDPNVAEAAGVKLSGGQAEKVMTPMQAMKRKTDLLTARVKLLKGNEIDALIASMNPSYTPGSSVDDKTKQAVDAQIESEIGELDKIISGGQQAGAGGTTQRNPLQGKPAGRYKINGQVVRWDGQRVVQ